MQCWSVLSVPASEAIEDSGQWTQDTRHHSIRYWRYVHPAWLIDREVWLPYEYDTVALEGYMYIKFSICVFSNCVLNSSLGYAMITHILKIYCQVCMVDDEDEDDLAGCQVIQMFQFLLLSNYRGFTNSSATDTMPFMASNTFYSLWLFCDVLSEHL